MNPERIAYIMIQDILGTSPRDIATLMNAEESEVKILLKSEFYQKEKSLTLDAFRLNATRNAADELAFAAVDAARFLKTVPQNLSFKAGIRLRAAMDILDRIPQTSKTLRSFSLEANLKDLTEEQKKRLESTANSINGKSHSDLESIIDIENSPLKELPEDVQFRENLKNLIDV